MGRRKGARTARRGRGSGGSTITGIRGFANTNYYSTVASGGENGVATGFGVASLFTVLSQSARPEEQTIAAKNLRWGMWANTAATGVYFFCFDNGGTPRFSPTYTITASDVGKQMLAVGVHDGSAVRLYVQRAQVGSGTAIAGLNASTANATAIGFGGSGVNRAATNLKIHGVASWRSVANLATVQAMFDAVKASRGSIASIGGLVTLTNAWEFNVGGGTSAIDPTVNLVGGADNVALTGSLSRETTPISYNW